MTIFNAANVSGKKKIEMLKLWTNASPTSSFKGQSITVSGLSDYDKYEIEFRFHTSLVTANTDTSRVGYGTLLNVNDGPNVYARNVTMAGNTLTFGDGKKMALSATSVSTDNGYIIPIAIYGIKGVQ